LLDLLAADCIVSDPRFTRYDIPVNQSEPPRRPESSQASLYSMHEDAIIQDVVDG
jgi:hypothetical protein